MFKWDDYLTLADELSQRSEEHCLRTAVSRAYYAAYGMAVAWYKTNVGPVPRPTVKGRKLGIHEALWYAFQDPKHADKSYADVGAKGDALRRQRTKPDYDWSYPGIQGDLPAILSKTRSILLNLKRM